MWGLWADLPLPTLLVTFDEARLREVRAGLAAFRGELARNDYAALVRGRAQMNAVLGPERVFGYGAPGIAAPFAELLTEALYRDDGWLLGAPRMLDTGRPLPDGHGGSMLDRWLDAPSPAALVTPPPPDA
jgi:hypothetical protein